MTSDEKELMKDLINQASNKVKQAQINVLNKVKEQLFFGVSLSYLRLYIDNLVKEVENDRI